MPTKSEDWHDRVLDAPNNDVSSPKILYQVPKDKGVVVCPALEINGS
jgi:hypothetical protein